MLLLLRLSQKFLKLRPGTTSYPEKKIPNDIQGPVFELLTTHGLLEELEITNDNPVVRPNAKTED
jgi:hypothetical protein